MKILILSNTPWRTDNSFGNSFENIFGGMHDVEIANIYCRYGTPNSTIVKKSFQITEKSLISNLKNSSIPSGVETRTDFAIDLNIKEEKIFNNARKRRWYIYFWLRDLIWKFGRWKSDDLRRFIDSVNPDLIFQPVYYSNYLNDIALYLKEYTNVPMVGYISDDNYTLRQFSLSPLYWIDRLIKRQKVKRTIDLCEILYVISDMQKAEYDKCFKRECKLLWKGAKFDIKPEYKTNNGIIKLVYTGNIGAGRYKQLANIGQALEQINKDGKKAELDIYTLTPMSSKMKKALDLPGSVTLKGGIPADRVAEIQSAADILVHVESFDLKSRLAVHQSFSTKIVDYLAQAKCIFAVGPADIASIDYLRKENAAVVATDKAEIKPQIEILINDRSKISEYGQKAWECGEKNHRISDIQSHLKKDFESLLEK